MGPYREKEGSFFTVREVWAPIQFKQLVITPSFKGEFFVSNTYLYTNLDQCRMEYRLFATPSPLVGGEQKMIASGEVVLPDLAPGETGRARMALPDNFFKGDVLELEAFDNQNRSICKWSWPVHYANDYLNQQMGEKTGAAQAEFIETDNNIVLIGSGVRVTFDKTTGMLTQVKNKRCEIPFNNGPVAVGMKIRFQTAYACMQGGKALFVAKYLGAIDSIVWRMSGTGLLSMDAVMLNRASGGKGFDDAFTDDEIFNFGLTFSFPEANITGMRWMGRGPYRVWKNRIKGTNYGIWHKKYNNTITGESLYGLEYPEFKGYHANLYWATLESDTTPFTVYSESDGVFFRVFTPLEPTGRQNGTNTMPDFPEGDLSFLYDIPAIRSFKPISQQGPQSQPGNIRIKKGDEGIRIKLMFDFN